MTNDLRVLNMVDLKRQEQERLDALRPAEAVQRLLDAVDALARREAERLNIPLVDPTYHGCDPKWRDLLYAAQDVRYVAGKRQPASAPAKK